MNKSEIIALQKRVGTEPDGFWGPKSIAACQRHLRSFMPKSNPWPQSNQKSLQSFYGSPGDESQLINLNVSPYNVKYEGKKVNTIRCHKKVADSLLRIIKDLYKINPDVLSKYAGVYNNRNMRGGSSPSLHARGAAIDLDPGKNGNSTSWPINASMPIEVMEAFSKEGWLSAGAFWGRDAMHFQATK